MNKSYLIHGLWVLVAIAAYAFGSRSSRSATLGATESSSTISTRISDRGTAENERTTSSLRAKRADSSSETRSYTKGEIENLGREFRRAKGPLARRKAFTKILEALTVENATLLREQIAHLAEDSPEFREFHYSWGIIGGEAAVDHGADTRKIDMAATLAGWMSNDPDAAMAYFDALNKDQQNGRGGMKWGAVYGLAENDPSRAVEFVKERAEAGDRDARHMMNITLDKVLEAGDINEAATLARTTEGTKLETSSYRHIAWKIAESDPSRAADWATTLPQGEGRNHAIGTSFHRWADEDPQAAAANISTLTDPSARDSAAYGFATRVASDDPVAGVEWAASIQDSDSRQRALYDTGRTFFRKDPEGALAWLPKSGLNTEQQNRLLERSKRKR